jgi:hypothetical protein
MTLTPSIHITDTERNVTRNIGKAFTRNGSFIGTLVILELRSAQQLH